MLNILFDAKILLNYKDKNDSRSGIYFFTYNVLCELIKRRDVNLVLWVDVKNLYYLKIMRRDLFPSVQLFYDVSEKCKWLFSVKAVLDCWWKNNLMRPVVRKPIALVRLFYEILLEHLFKGVYKKKLKKYDSFFEPFESVPTIVRQCPNIRCYSVLHDAIPFVMNYMGRRAQVGIRHQIEFSSDRDIFFCVSENTRKDFCRIFPKLTNINTITSLLAASPKFHAVRSMDALKRIKKKYCINFEKRYVFSLCTLEPRKNLIRAVRSFVAFLEKNKIEDLVWVMGGGHWESFVKTLKKNNVSWNPKYIIRAGYIDDEDLPVLYSNAEWFVYTSQYEGFGLPPLEAMQCGCPVITSNNSSLPEVVGDAGIMIDWDSDEQHIDAYEKYYFNEKLRKENSYKGLERAKSFSWEKTVDIIVNAIKKNIS